MKRVVLLLALAAVLVCGSAHADTATWNVQVTGLPASVFTGSSAITFFAQTPSATPFENSPSNFISNVVVATIGTASSATSGSPDNFTSTTGAYGFSVAVTSNGGTSTPVGVAGYLSGPLWGNGSNLANTFTSSAQQVSVGGHTFTVTPELYTSPSGTGAFGTLEVQVTVGGFTDGGGGGGGGGGNLADTPEPTSLMLSCMGLTMLGAASWRKRRNVVAA